MMDRRKLHDAVESCHARGQAEDAYNRRMRLMREVDELMQKYIKPIINRSKK